jgi:hypothetical protein
VEKESSLKMNKLTMNTPRRMSKHSVTSVTVSPIWLYFDVP